MTNENLYDPSLRQVGKVFLHYLNARGAKYLVIGGHAVLLYVGDRELGVDDLDIVIEPNNENAAKVHAALHDYDPGLASKVSIDWLTRPEKKVGFGDGGDFVEIVTSTKSQALSFDDLWRDRRLVSVSVSVGGEMSEFDASFVSKAHLLQLKLESIEDPARPEEGKEKDKKDVESLR